MFPGGWTVRHFDTVASTNDLAADRAVKGDPEGTVVWADSQSSGRGRSGRTWTSPSGNLYCSVILRPESDLASAANLSFVVANALRSAISECCPYIQPQLKWPNDILISGKKICGILLESGAKGGLHVVAGTGINVAAVPSELNASSTSLAMEGCSVSPRELLSVYLFALADRLSRWRQFGFKDIREEWLEHCTGLGQPVVVRAGNSRTSGIFEGLDPDGALILRKEEGELSTFLAADIFFSEAAESGEVL